MAAAEGPSTLPATAGVPARVAEPPVPRFTTLNPWPSVTRSRLGPHRVQDVGDLKATPTGLALSLQEHTPGCPARVVTARVARERERITQFKLSAMNRRVPSGERAIPMGALKLDSVPTPSTHHPAPLPPSVLTTPLPTPYLRMV